MTSLGPGGRLSAADVVRYLAHLGVLDRRRRTEPGRPEAAVRPPISGSLAHTELFGPARQAASLGLGPSQRTGWPVSPEIRS